MKPEDFPKKISDAVENLKNKYRRYAAVSFAYGWDEEKVKYFVRYALSERLNARVRYALKNDLFTIVREEPGTHDAERKYFAEDGLTVWFSMRQTVTESAA